MRRVATPLACVLVALAAALAAAAPASAALAIDPARASEFPERTYTVHAPEGIALTADDVTVSENGLGIEGIAVESAASGAGNRFGSVLVIDSSDTMVGPPITAAMDAARAFADHRASGQRLGIVTFNRDAHVLLGMTSSEEDIVRVLSTSPAVNDGTRLYDAVDAALAMIEESGVDAGSVVVLSDGADLGHSESTPGDLVARAEASGVRIFAVGLRSPRFNPDVLERIAVGAPAVDARDPDDLEAIFDRFGAQVASEHLVTYNSVSKPGAEVTVEIAVSGLGEARDHYTAPAATAVPAKTEETGFWASPQAMVGAILIAGLLLGLALFGLLRPQLETPRERLARFLRVGGVGPEDQPGRGRSASESGGGLLASLSRALEGRQWWTRFEETVEIARIDARPVRIVALTLVGTATAGLFAAAVLDAPAFVPLALGVPVGVRGWILRALRKQRREFADQLADNLQLVASALRSGQSMAGALAVVVEEASEPARTEFRRIVSDERLGVPLEDAIRDVGRRMDNRDLEQVALVATIQKQTGGNTAEVLDQVVETIRERGKLRRMMDTLTAQGRLSQAIVTALPLVLLVAITLINRDYVDPLFSTAGGHIALAIGASLSLMGSLIIKRIVEIRV